MSGTTVNSRLFAGTTMELIDLIDHLESDPPSSPDAFLREYPAVSRDDFRAVLTRLADTMRTVDACEAVLVARGGTVGLPYFLERLEQRAVVEAWRDVFREVEP